MNEEPKVIDFFRVTSKFELVIDKDFGYLKYKDSYGIVQQIIRNGEIWYRNGSNSLFRAGNTGIYL